MNGVVVFSFSIIQNSYSRNFWVINPLTCLLICFEWFLPWPSQKVAGDKEVLIWNITAGGARLTSSVSTPGAADVQVLCFGNMGIYDDKKDLLLFGSVSFEDWYWFNVLLKLALLDPYTSWCRHFLSSLILVLLFIFLISFLSFFNRWWCYVRGPV